MTDLIKCRRCGERKYLPYMSKNNVNLCIPCYSLIIKELEEQASNSPDAASQLGIISKRLQSMEITMADNASMLVEQFDKLRESIMEVSLAILAIGKLYAKSKGMVADKDETKEKPDD